MDKQYDDSEIYCRKLGHHLTFKYCRSENNFLPCSKITECWNERIDINKYCSDNYQKEDLEKLQNNTKPKIMSILEIIQKINEND